MKVKDAFNKIIEKIKNILFGLFGKYEPVITKQDWKSIKKSDIRVYKKIRSKKSIGRCYEISRLLAICLKKGAKLLYCSGVTKDGERVGHAVVLIDSWIYDTNARRHYDCEQWIKQKSILVYKIFEEKDYLQENFFDSIAEDFKYWCKANNVDSGF